MADKSVYKRVLLKLSGEALMGSQSSGIDEEVVAQIADEIRDVCELGVELAVVIGLQDSLEKCGVTTRVQTAIEIRDVAEPFIRRRAIRHLEKGRVVIFAGGTGNPYFTTDSAAGLRANEIHAEILLKGTNVDGVYTADPAKDPTAELLKEVSYQQVLEKNLGVMDTAAISLCRDNDIPIIVFRLMKPGNIRRVVCGEKVGSVVH